MHNGFMNKWFDTACQPFGPAYKVAHSGPSASSSDLTICESYAFRRSPSRMSPLRAMTLHLVVNSKV